jgi:hypothetical protein
MPEHVHLLITEPEVRNPSTVMQVLKQRYGPRVVAEQKAARSAPAKSVRGRSRPSCVLAGALLRLQRLDDEEASGKAEVYASQSGEAGVGGVSRTMALEQLSVLSVRRNRAGAGQRGVDGDFVSRSCRLKVSTKPLMMSAVRYPPLQKKRKDGAPTFVVVSARLKGHRPNRRRHNPYALMANLIG